MADPKTGKIDPMAHVNKDHRTVPSAAENAKDFKTAAETGPQIPKRDAKPSGKSR